MRSGGSVTIGRLLRGLCEISNLRLHKLFSIITIACIYHGERRKDICSITAMDLGNECNATMFIQNNKIA